MRALAVISGVKDCGFSKLERKGLKKGQKGVISRCAKGLNHNLEYESVLQASGVPVQTITHKQRGDSSADVTYTSSRFGQEN